MKREIFIRDLCPFCIRVINYAKHIKHEDIIWHNITRAEAINLGIQTVPALKQDDNNYLCDSMAICHILASDKNITLDPQDIV